MNAIAAGTAAPLVEAGRALAAADVPTLVLSEPAEFPAAELLVPHRHAGAAERALERVSWRWSMGRGRVFAFPGSRRYIFDGGHILTVHAALPVGPLPRFAGRPLERALWADSSSQGNFRRSRSEPLLVYLGVQVARGAARAPAHRAELLAHAERVADWGEVRRLARRLGVAGTLRSLLADRPQQAELPRALPVTARLRSVAWRAAGVMRARGRPQALWDTVIGEPWRRSVTRCRFCDLELLAGPGTFLPRRASEPLVTSAVERLTEVDHALLVDVGTGCGAVALALARRLPNAHVLGVDLDPGAVAWARRNGKHLGLAHADFAAGSLLDPLPQAWQGRVSLIVANVPCIPPDSFEGALDAPARAYVGSGPDGLDLHRRLAEQARNALRTGGWLLVQLAPLQWRAYRQTLEQLGYQALEARGDDVAVAGAGRWLGRS